MLARLAALVSLFVSTQPAWAAADPLTAAALGEGASLVVRPRVAGLEVSFLPGPDAPRRWTLSLLSPRGASSAEVSVTFPPERVAPLVVVLPRPTREVPDGDLRLNLAANGRDLVGLVAPWLEAPRLRLLGDVTALAGTRYAPRVVAAISTSGCAHTPCERPLEGATITARLVREGKKRAILAESRATTDGSGSAPIAIDIPAEVPEGELALEVELSHRDGVASTRQALRVVSRARVLVSTDKPIYQPGQTVHLRLLARDQGTGRAAGQRTAAFSVFDAKNNKVFQKRGATSPEGVFHAEMDLATLVNVGRWRIVAKVGEDEVERTVEVRPYVLPKFKVELTAERGAYRPGERVKGAVSARYFFGEPLRKARVELVAETFDVTPRELVRVALALDDAGSGRFDFELPNALVGQPLLQGAATVQLTARVTDTAGQSQEGRRSLTVYSDPLRVLALPEAGRLVPGVDNTVFFVVTTPDGAPAAHAKLTLDGAVGTSLASLETDARGIAEWHVTPAGALALDVVAQAKDGAEARHRVSLDVAPGSNTRVLLRPSNVAPRGGDRVDFEVLVSGVVPHVFVDLVKDGQTLVTLSGPVREGRARITTTLPPELAGTVLAHAYAIGADMDVYADTRPLVVRQADELRVEVVASGKPHFAPGEATSLELKVSDRAGHPVLAALGLWVVDEAVFSLSEIQPGMERVFFLLEQAIMAPKVEVHAFEPDRVFFPRDPPRPGDERPARVLAAAAMPTFEHDARADSRAGERERSQALWQELFDARVKRLSQAVRAWIQREWRSPSGREVHRILAAAGVRPDHTRDWFGVPFRVDVSPTTDPIGEASLRSAGPDAVWGTDDDFEANLGIAAAMEPVWELQARREAERWARQGMVFGVGAGGAFGLAGDGVGGGGVGVGRIGVRHGPRMKLGAGGIIDSLGGSAPDAPRLRSYFPETLYVNPLVLTDADGRARIDLTMADSITTWRLSALASTADGRLGSASAGLEVFQDFFVDVDFPASLTRKDEVSVPLAIYNYLPEAQTIELTLTAEGGLETRGDTSLSVRLGPNEVKGIEVPLVATRVGLGRLTVVARGTHLSDAVRREVRIEPDGFPVTRVDSGMIGEAIELVVDVPEGAIEAASTALLKLYPGLFAQVVDGLENMLRMPSGCFEQTSSTTYPNILVLRYLRDAKKSKPELEATALAYLQAGWQRLVTYEVPGGGFSWFGDAPANQILTAYGLMEFEDMDKVMGVDRQVIARTRAWLVGKQQRDGSFRPDASHLHEESWGDIQKSSLLVSAYITWSLAHTRPDRRRLDAPLERALAYLRQHLGEADDAYVLAYLALAFAEAGADRPGADKTALRQVLARLAALAVRDGDALHFPTDLRTATYGSGEAATLEVTALALRAFMRAGEHLELVKPGLAWLTQRKDQLGNWQTTQATIQVLQAMVASLSTQQEPIAGVVEISVNGAALETARYTPEDFDVVRFIDASPELVPGRNTIRITPSAGMRPMYQLVQTSHLPWGDPRQPAAQAFDVKVTYDRTTLDEDDVVGVRVDVRSNLPGKAEMGIVDVAVPPGFEVFTEDLERAVADRTIQRFSLAGRQIILYVAELSPSAPFTITYRVRARFPVRAASGAARVYEYYNPDHGGLAAPAAIVVGAGR